MNKQGISNKSINRVDIIGVPISAVNMESCIYAIFDDFNIIKGQYICVSNVHTTVMAHDDPLYYKAQTESFMSVPDGKPLSVLGRKKFPEMDRVTGPDLMRRIFEESKNKELRHFFYGNTKENLDIFINYLKKEYPWLIISGYEPSVFRDMSSDEEDMLALRINDSKPDFVWVALGAPRQELFCNRMKGKIYGLMVGVGGAFNVISGIVPEAPDWIKNCGLEWFFRLIQEPKRLFKRYTITNTKFLFYLVTKKKKAF